MRVLGSHGEKPICATIDEVVVLDGHVFTTENSNVLANKATNLKAGNDDVFDVSFHRSDLSVLCDVRRKLDITLDTDTCLDIATIQTLGQT